MRFRVASLTGGPPSLKTETVIFASATLVERLLAILMVLLLTRAVAPNLFGVWSQVLVSVSLLGTFATVGLGTAGVKFLAGRSDEPFIHRWFRRLTLPVLANAVVLAMVLLVFSRWSSGVIFGDTSYGTFAVGLGLLTISEAVFEMQTQMLRARQRIAAISAYMIAKSVIRLAAIVLVIYVAERTLSTALIVIVVLQALLVIIVEIREAPARPERPIEAAGDDEIVTVRAVAVFALPLFVYSALVMAHVVGIRYVLAHMLDVESVGILAVAMGLTSSTVGLVFAVLGFTLYPRLASAWNRSEHAEVRSLIHRGIEVYALIVAPMAAVLVAVPEEITGIVAGSEYKVGVMTMALLVAGITAFGAYQLIFYLMLTSGGINRSFPPLIMGLIVQFGGAALLIDRMGLEGAALAFFLGNAVMVGGTRQVQRRMFDAPLPWHRLGETATAAVAMAGSAAAVRMLLSAWPIVPRAGAAALIGLAVFAGVRAGFGLHRHLGFERRSAVTS